MSTVHRSLFGYYSSRKMREEVSADKSCFFKESLVVLYSMQEGEAENEKGGG